MARSKSAARRKYGPKQDPELDLKPIMNLMVVLIPMLLYSAQFIKFASVNITKASKGSGAQKTETNPEEQKPPLNLKVKITSEGFIVEGAMILDEEKVVASPGGDDTGGFQPVELYTVDVNGDLASTALRRLKEEYTLKGKTLPPKTEEMVRQIYSYDFKKLNKKIDLIKKAVNNGGGGDAFDKVGQIVLASEGDLPFELLIQTMDAVRCRYDDNSKGYTSCKPKSDSGKEDPNTLYYDVVLDAALLE